MSDGVLDGLKTGGAAVVTASGTAIPLDIDNKFGTALIAYNNTLGGSALTADKIGNPPFVKTALTDSYKIEYVPGMMAAAAGKTSFQIKVTNLVGGTPATGKAITLTPKMHMSGMAHSSPVDSVVESGTAGTYICNVYYLMATMGGYWELKVDVGGEIAIFYPSVGMSMGTTAKATLLGSATGGAADLIAGMMGMGTNPRPYLIFFESLTNMNKTFNFYLAAQNDGDMTLYPAVFNGSKLNNPPVGIGVGAEWTVSIGASAIQLSSNAGTNWVDATSTGGHWSATFSSALTTGSTVRVKININGDQKTTSAGLDYALFTIASGM